MFFQGERVAIDSTKVDNTKMQQLIQLIDASVTRNGIRLAGPFTCALQRGQHLALVGSNGSGKTTLLKLLRGEYLPDTGGKRIYDFGEGKQETAIGLRQRIGLVSADMQDFYTLHAPRTHGRDIILAGFFDTPLLYEEATEEHKLAADEIITLLGIKPLASAKLGTLSTGQLRKLLIARGLVTKPDVLLLDESLEGLDADSRTEILTLLEKAAKVSTLVCAAHRLGDVPQCINRTIIMREGAIVIDGDRADALEALQETAPSIAACDLPIAAPTNYEFLLRMHNVSVVSDGVRFLHNIHWEILPGENWLVLGENGAGKSTLLKLITSEIAPYADDDDGVGTIERLGGLTMDEVRPRIGVVSPALQVTYARELAWEVTVLETILSGFRGSVGMLDEPTDFELTEAQAWLDRIGMADLATRSLRRMSYGQQRRIFLARAMAANPDLLLLDEPMAGLDTLSRTLMLDFIQQLAEAGTPIIMVTHHAEDQIPAINRVMEMSKGRQSFCGTRDDFHISRNSL